MTSDFIHSKLTSGPTSSHALLATLIFTMDGTVVSANDIFLEALGYHLQDIQGEHHSLFLDLWKGGNASHHGFWEHLCLGMVLQTQCKYIGKQGQEVWLDGVHVPALYCDHRPLQVIALGIVSRKTKPMSTPKSRLETGEPRSPESKSCRPAEQPEDVIWKPAAPVPSLSATGEKIKNAVDDVADALAQKHAVTRLSVNDMRKSALLVKALLSAIEIAHQRHRIN